jgi:hypothetical protein
MPGNVALFLFLASTIVAVFAFLSIAVWVTTPSEERQARERLALLRTVAEQPGENATRVLEMLQEEDRRKAEKEKREEASGFILGGSLAAATGVGLSVMLLVMQKSAWAVGLIPILIGAVLIVTGFLARRKSLA